MQKLFAAILILSAACVGCQDREPDQVSTPIDSVVRIRVINTLGTTYGSGVVTELADGHSCVLTCWHLAKMAADDGLIIIECFESGRPAWSLAGKIIATDPDADLAALGFPNLRLRKMTPAVLSSIGANRGWHVYSVGCSEGDVPTIQRHTVTAINRYQGPDTVECDWAPLHGRSGGPLFSRAGCVIGICTNADRKKGRGVYTGLKPIRALLRKAS